MKTLPRYCDFFPTSRGWYMTLAPKANGGEETADVYGPVPSLCEIQMFMRKFIHPGDYVAAYELCAVPKLAPNGKAIIPIEMSLQPVSVLGLKGLPARFIVDSRDGGNCAYDTGTGMQFWLEKKRVAEVAPRDFWSADTIRLKDRGIDPFLPTTEGEWEALLDAIIALLKHERGYKGKIYCPAIIRGLPRQPLTLRQINQRQAAAVREGARLAQDR